MSRIHAKVIWIKENKHFVLQNVSKSSRTMLNGKAVSVNSTIELKDRDKIVLGKGSINRSADYVSSDG